MNVKISDKKEQFLLFVRSDIRLIKKYPGSSMMSLLPRAHRASERIPNDYTPDEAAFDFVTVIVHGIDATCNPDHWWMLTDEEARAAQEHYNSIPDEYRYAQMK